MKVSNMSQLGTKKETIEILEIALEKLLAEVKSMRRAETFSKRLINADVSIFKKPSDGSVNYLISCSFLDLSHFFNRKKV